MTRDPSAQIPTPRYGLPMLSPAADRSAYKALFAAARAAFPAASITGLVAVNNERAWFQALGDTTPYSIAITADESALFI